MRIAILTTDRRESMLGCADPQPRFGIAPEALLQGFAQLPESEIHVVSCLKQPLRSQEKIADNIFYHGVVVPRIGWLRTGYQGCIRAVRKKLKEIQPDIVHGQGTERDCAISAAFSGFPNLVTVHGNMKSIAAFHRAPVGGYFWLAARLETLALRRTGGVFCNSAYTEQLVKPRARRVWRVANALRAPFFKVVPSPGPRRPLLLNIGTLEPYKRQVELLALARRLWERGLRFELDFVGESGGRMAYVVEFLRQVAVAEKDGFARHIVSLPVDPLVTTMDDAAALMHVPAEEAFGLVVAEALARNLKFFGFATGGLTDIVAEVEGAELFPAGDWQALEGSVVRWIQAGCPRPQTAAAVMRQRYHPETIARRHLEIYCEVLGGR